MFLSCPQSKTAEKAGERINHRTITGMLASALFKNDDFVVPFENFLMKGTRIFKCYRARACCER